MGHIYLAIDNFFNGLLEIGCYGEGNLGDEAILLGLQKLLSRIFSSPRFMVFVGDEQYFTAHDDEVLDLSLFKPRHWHGLLAKGKLLHIYNAIRQSDYFVIGG